MNGDSWKRASKRRNTDSRQAPQLCKLEGSIIQECNYFVELLIIKTKHVQDQDWGGRHHSGSEHHVRGRGLHVREPRDEPLLICQGNMIRWK